MDYEAHKKRAREYAARQSAGGREIAPLPPIKDPRRRADGMRWFQAFLEIYFPQTFSLPWSRDHKRILPQIQHVIQHGGLKAMALPRGGGKSSIMKGGVIWAGLGGWQPYTLIVTAEKLALKRLEDVRTELATNQLLLEDFPEVVYPIHKLRKIAQNATGQTFRGSPTHVEWTKQRVILATIPGSRASGAVIEASSIVSVRGFLHTRPDGTPVRPSLVLVDDPQTDDSARSATQNEHRESILMQSILNLGGPATKLAVFVLGTVIAPGDMMERVLDRNLHPEFRGERTKMVYSFPSNEKLWGRYAEIRADDFAAGGDGNTATEFYAQNRQAMDEGADVAWPERHSKDEISGLQHAMNLKLRDERAFAAEGQNEPLPPASEAEMLTAEEINGKRNGRERGEVPKECEYLVGKIDVHDKLLYWTVLAASGAFRGYVVDYGAYPDQQRAHFSLRNARVTLRHKAPRGAKTKEGAILAGLVTLFDILLRRDFQRDDGTATRIQRLLIDIGYLPEVVENAVLQDGRKQILTLSRGIGIGAGHTPLVRYKGIVGKPGHYTVSMKEPKRRLRVLWIDTNYYKSFLHARFAGVPGEPGSFSLWGPKAGKPKLHQLYGEHLTAEYFTEATGRWGRVQEWSPKPTQPDNHWLDTTAGSCAAASVQGAHLPGSAPPKESKRRRRRVRYLD